MHAYVWDFPGGLDGKESTCNVGDLSLIPGLGRFPGEGKGYPQECSGLEKSMGWQRVGNDSKFHFISLHAYVIYVHTHIYTQHMCIYVYVYTHITKTVLNTNFKTQLLNIYNMLETAAKPRSKQES